MSTETMERELTRGQTFRGGVPQQIWLFTGYDTSLDVDIRLQEMVFAGDRIPIVWGGLPIDLPGRGIDEHGGGVWTVTLTWSAKAGSIVMPGGDAPTQQASQHGGEGGAESPVAPDIRYSVRGATQKITQSIETKQKKATGVGDAPSYGRAIGVKGDGTVEGCDVLRPEVTWSRKCLIPAYAFTGAYARKLEDKVGSTNFDEFFGYAAGEVLFVGADVDYMDGSGHRPATFDFAVKRNQEEVEVSDDPPLHLEDVGGWWYVWVIYSDKTVTVDGKDLRVTQPKYAYAERVYPESTFADLNLESYRTVPPTTPEP